MTEYFDFINESGPGAISAARASYGLDDGYQDSTVVPGRSSLSDALRLICPEIYPSGSRNIKVTSDNGQTYKIDFQGRPSEAYTGIGKKLDRGGRLTDKLKVTMQIHSWGFDPRNERYGEYYVPNAPSDWYDGEGRRLVDNWKKLFELCG